MRQVMLAAYLAVFASFAQANEPRLEILERSGMLERMAQFGDWEKSYSKGALVLTCLDCLAPVRIFFVVRNHTVSHQGQDLSQSYLAERKAYCQRLVSDAEGRCERTNPITIRWLAGHRGQAVDDGRYLSELVLFYGGHALTAIVQETDSFEQGDRLAEFLMHALLRMTPAW